MLKSLVLFSLMVATATTALMLTAAVADPLAQDIRRELSEALCRRSLRDRLPPFVCGRRPHPKVVVMRSRFLR